MKMLKSLVERILASVDVKIGGGGACDIVVHDERFYRRALLEGSMGLGESYVHGWWDCADLEELAFRFVRSGIETRARMLPGMVGLHMLSRLVNLQPRALGRKTAEHYNTDNELFAAFLGRYKIYSCGYYRDGDDLDEAQRNKMEVICDKLDLSSTDRVLDIGGGWGEIARHMATTRGCHVTSINISEEQMRYARELCTGTSAQIVRSDYRDIQGVYDKVSIIAMMSHVGPKNHHAFFEKVHSVLQPGGTVFIDTVGANVSLHHANAWIDKYVFPGAVFPSLAQISRAAEGLFVIEEVQNHGPAYVKTLRAWNENMQRNWPQLAKRHDERTRRMFEFFFQCVAGFFRARDFQNYYLVLTKSGAEQPTVGASAAERPMSVAERREALA